MRRGEQELELSPTEYSLLRFLLANAERVMSKAQILDHVWNYDFRGDAGVVETFISSLRKKLDVGRPSADPNGSWLRLRAADQAVIRRPRSLRFRVIAVAVLLVVVGMVVVNLIALFTLRANLLAKVDQELLGVPGEAFGPFATAATAPQLSGSGGERDELRLPQQPGDHHPRQLHRDGDRPARVARPSAAHRCQT